MKTLYLVGGPMGVGKTAVCQRLKRDLPNSVFLDGDWCWNADPFQVTAETRAMALDNIRHLLGNFLRCTAYENVIFCWVMDRQDILDGVLAGLDTSGCRVVPVSLTASEEALTARIRADAAAGRRGPDAVERSLARLPLYRDLNTVKIDTTSKSIPEICREIAAL